MVDLLHLSWGVAGFVLGFVPGVVVGIMLTLVLGRLADRVLTPRRPALRGFDFRGSNG